MANCADIFSVAYELGRHSVGRPCERERVLLAWVPRSTPEDGRLPGRKYEGCTAVRRCTDGAGSVPASCCRLLRSVEHVIDRPFEAASR